MQQVKWAEFELQELFDIENTLSFNKDRLVEGDEYDYVTRTSQNQGVLQTTGFVNKENINSAGTWSLGLLQMDFFYREKPWYAGQFVRKIIPKLDLNKSAVAFFSTILNKQKQNLLSVLVRNVDNVFKSTKISLPIKPNANLDKLAQIDFDFMENFISQLEAFRLSQLEAFRLSQLEAYLLVTGLKDYTLTAAEQQALADFENGKVVWGEFKIGDLFERISTRKLNYKAVDLPKEAQGEYILPCLTSSFQNQGLNYYAPQKGATILKNVISLPSNSDVYRGYYQSREFTVLSDAYAIQWSSKKVPFLSQHYLFSVVCINKVTDLKIYSYKNKLGGWNVVQNKYINFPIKNGEMDYGFMETLISAVQKLVIKDVVLYADRKIAATRQVIERG